MTRAHESQEPACHPQRHAAKQATWDTPPVKSLKNQGQPDWPALPVTPIPLNRIVFPCHDIDPAHVHGAEGLTLSTGPIHLEQLLDGAYYVHDGRHRVHRAILRGDTHIPAHVHP